MPKTTPFVQKVVNDFTTLDRKSDSKLVKRVIGRDMAARHVKPDGKKGKSSGK